MIRRLGAAFDLGAYSAYRERLGRAISLDKNKTAISPETPGGQGADGRNFRISEGAMRRGEPLLGSEIPPYQYYGAGCGVGGLGWGISLIFL